MQYKLFFFKNINLSFYFFIKKMCYYIKKLNYNMEFKKKI